MVRRLLINAIEHRLITDIAQQRLRIVMNISAVTPNAQD